MSVLVSSDESESKQKKMESTKSGPKRRWNCRQTEARSAGEGTESAVSGGEL